MTSPFGRRLAKIGAGLNQLSASESVRANSSRQLGIFREEERLQEERALKEQQRATDFANQFKMNLLEDVNSRLGETSDEAMRSELLNARDKLAQDLGVSFEGVPAAVPSKEAGSDFTLSPGQVRFGADGEEIARGLEKEEKKTSSEFERLASIPEAELSNIQRQRLRKLAGSDPTVTELKAQRKERKRLERAENFEEARSQFQETGKLSDLITARIAAINSGQGTAAQKDKAISEVRKASLNLVKTDALVDEIRTLATSNSATATIAADVAGGVVGIADNVLGLVDSVVDVDQFDINTDEIARELTNVAGDNNQLRGALYSLAIMEAAEKGLTRGKLSVTLVKDMLKQVGATSRSPQAIARRSAEVYNRIRKNFETQLKIGIGDFSSVDEVPDEIGAQPTPPSSSTGPVPRFKIENGKVVPIN